MGCEYRSFALIGIKVDPKIFVGAIVIEKAFSHDYPETMKFDPGTGKRLWVEREVSHPAYNSHLQTFGGFKIVTNESDDAWIAICVASDDDYGDGDGESFRRLPPNFEAKKDALRCLLQPLGAWKESKFGLYAVQYVSV